MFPSTIAPPLVSRRVLLQTAGWATLGGGLAPLLGSAPGERRPAVRVGLVTDLHYADKPPAGTRHYRETLDKLAVAARQFDQERPDAVVELGDFIDAAAEVDTELAYLERIQQNFRALPGAKHYVLGNHCVDMLTKEEFLKGVGQERSWYSFDIGGVHFVVLDACFRADGAPYGRRNARWDDANIPQEQIDWLKKDLREHGGPTIVCVHQRLDVANSYGVKNAPAVRRVLEESRQVKLVLQGHSHKNDLTTHGGIPYCTLVAMVEGTGAESSGFALLDVFADGSLTLTGFQRQQSRRWPEEAPPEQRPAGS